MRAALPDDAQVVAIDQSPLARRVYQAWWGDAPLDLNLVGIRDEQLAGFDLWWLSPPCQPFTVKGARRDWDDPRTAALKRLLEGLQRSTPRALILENVPGFIGSQAHAHLRRALEGWTVREVSLCPTDLGVPARRRRFFVVAVREGTLEVGPIGADRRPLGDFLGPWQDALALPQRVLETHREVLPVVRPDGVAECFTSSYGRSLLRSGSYLRTERGVRRFHPDEIARLYGFDQRFPSDLSLRQAWKAVGNTVSVDVVRALLGWLSSGR